MMINLMFLFYIFTFMVSQAFAVKNKHDSQAVAYDEENNSFRDFLTLFVILFPFLLFARIAHFYHN